MISKLTKDDFNHSSYCIKCLIDGEIHLNFMYILTTNSENGWMDIILAEIVLTCLTEVSEHCQPQSASLNHYECPLSDSKVACYNPATCSSWYGGWGWSQPHSAFSVSHLTYHPLITHSWTLDKASGVVVLSEANHWLSVITGMYTVSRWPCL